MGTNYYIKEDVCEYCGRSGGQLHLGKSSAGWKYAIQANDFQYYRNWEEMKEFLKDKDIYNEYGEKVEVSDFIKMVESKQDEMDSDYNIEIKGYRFCNGEFS